MRRLAILTALVLAVAVASEASYVTAVTDLNPVSYWRLNETSGTVAADQMGANAGAYYNYGTGGGPGEIGAAGPRPSDGLGGFGANNYAPHSTGSDVSYGDPLWTAADSVSLSITNALTVSAWFNPNSMSAEAEIVSKYRYSGGNDYSWRLYYLASSGRVGFRV